jgi:hypothetical protein
MSHLLSRRQFLRSAGGITFLALTPVGRGLFAASGHPRLPLFTVLPYIQPGPGSRLVDGQESMVVAWQTQAEPADFTVDFGPSKAYGRRADVTSSSRGPNSTRDGETRLNYHAPLTGLALGRKYYYRLRGNGRTLFEGYLTTRRPRGHAIRFVAFGDNSFGDISDRAIAYHTYRQHPDFVMNTGDNVYDGGLDNEYQRYFFPVYNSDTAAPRAGAPLLRSVPFYTVIGNHDVRDRDAEQHPIADFKRYPDSLAYYTAMHLPLNGLETPAHPTPMTGPQPVVDGFKECAGPRYPRMANYSFDYGDAHFLCLDSNVYVDTTDRGLVDWISADLSATDAPWKFVVYHHPAFNVGREHYQEQQMRVLCPLFDAHGVQFVLSGHEHNYQRTAPLRFAPSDTAKAGIVGAADRRIPGAFTIDRSFDGVKRTRPNGIIHITTGAGGRRLYEPDFTDSPENWKHPDDGNVEYVVKMVADRHSLTVFDIEGEHLTMTQVDEEGRQFDRITVTL